jgi:hypothetical protein
MPSFLIFRTLFNIIEDVVDGFFGVVSCDSVFDIGEEFGIMFNCLERKSDTIQ